MKIMKKTRKSGITLVALSIYIVAMVIIVALISLLTTFFYGNVLNMSDITKDIVEFDQFNAYMVEETQKVGSQISNLNEENKTVAFTSGNVYTMEESGIYCNDVRVYQANLDLANSYFSIKQENGKDILVISVLTDTSYTRTEEYVIDPAGVAIYETEENYTGQEFRVPIPDGYVASQVEGENTVEDGLVIYERTNPVTEANHATALTTRNQYVWIPVDDINSMVMCRSNSGTSVCDLLYDEEENTLTCQTHPDTPTDLVGRLYTSTLTSTTEGDNTIYSYTMDFKKRDQTYDENSYREPDTVSDDVFYSITIDQLKSDFTVMAKSVAKNGGFYISRYEVGEGGNSKKGQAVLTAEGSDGSNYLGANMWYGLYNTIRKIDENKQMIWGCQYDQVIKFLKERGEAPEIGHTYIVDSRALSGQNEQDCMKNIYDLEGNHYEWTAEAHSTDYRALRGSIYLSAFDGDFYPASYRWGGVHPGQINGISSRTTLYL